MTIAPPRTLAAFIDQMGGRAVCLAMSRDPNAKVTILLFPPGAGRPAYVAKVPTTDIAAGSVEREAQRLAEVGRRIPGPVNATVPRLAATVEHHGRPALVMTALPGQSMLAAYHSWRHTARRQAVAADFAAAGGWLAELHETVGGPTGDGGDEADGTAGGNRAADGTAPNGGDGRVSLALMLDGVADTFARRFGGEPGAGADQAGLTALRDRLADHRTPRCVVHGDFWVGNLLADKGRVLGVIDWEQASLNGSPVRDLARFATSYSLYLDRHTRPGHRVPGHRGLVTGRWGAGVEYAIDGTGWYPDLVRSFVMSGLKRLGAAPSCWRDVLVADVAASAASADHDDFARNHLLLFRRLTGRRQ